MELFLPSLLIIVLAAIVVFAVIPRFAPITLTVIAILLLIFGVLHHYNLFYDEYRLSTWQTSSFVAPALVIGVALFFILGYILSYFGSGVPTPVLPNIPSVGDITTGLSNAATSAATAVTNAANKAVNTVAGVANRGTTGIANSINNSLRLNNRRSTLGSLANRLP
jgi:uncharacterized protein (UPF0333 family)